MEQLALEKVTADQEALTKLATEKVQAEQQTQTVSAGDLSIKEQLRSNQAALNEMQPAANIQTPKSFSQLDIAGKINWVIEKLRPTGYQVERKDIGTIKFGSKQLKGAFKYFTKGSIEEAAFEALPYVLQNGVQIAEHTDHKDRSYGTVTLAAPVTIDGKRGNMAVVVKKTTENFYKVHRILTPEGSVFELTATENEAEPTPAGELPNNGSLATPISSASIDSISETEPGVNGENSIAEGKILRGNDAVEVADIASAGGGKLTVTLTDGSTADVSELSFSEVGEQELWRVLAEYADNTEAVRQLLKEYRAGELGAYEYARGVEEGFLYGKLNIGAEEMSQRGSYVNLLNPMQRNAAYRQGQYAGEKQTKKRQAEASERNAKRTRKGGVHYGYAGQKLDKSKLTKAQRVGVDFAERLAKKKGMTFYFYRSYVNSQGQRVYKDQKGQTVAADKNGWYDPSDGSIHIDLNCGDMGGTVLFTLAHELTHFIQDWSPERYRTLCGILTEGYLEMGQSVQELVQHKQEQYRAKGEELSYEQAFDEVIASSMEGVLNDGRVLELLDDIEAKDKSLYEKVRSFIEDVAALVYETMQAYRDLKPDSPEGRIVQRMQGIHEQLRQVFAEGLHEGGENYRQGGKENTTPEGGARNQFRMTDAEIQAVQNIGRISVNQFTAANIKATERFARQYWKEMGVKSPFFRAWFGDWRANDQTKVQVASQKGDSRGVQRNADTGWDIQVSGKVFNETKSHNMSFNNAAVPYLPYINDIVSKAILLDSSGVDVGRAKSNNSLLMHSLYAVADIGNGLEIIKLYVEEMNDPNVENTSKRAYQLQNIEKYHYATKGSQNTASPRSVASGTVHTVADLFAAVKQKDSSFQPKPASKIVNADGTPMVVYHGTNAEWTQYDLTKNVNQMWGEGIYLTPDPKRAALYGDIVMPFYVKADTDNRAAKKSGKQRDYTIMKNGDVLVYSPNQIKSATDNIGTFDSKNPDIRYSVRYQKNAAAQEQLRMENTSMGEDVAGLNELVAAQRKRGGNAKLREGALQAAASVLMEKAGARGKRSGLMELLDQFYQYVGSGQEMNWDGIRKAAKPVVDWLMDHAARNKQLSEYSREVLQELRTSRIYLDETQKEEAAYLFGSFGAYRKMLMGSVTIANEGSMSLDSRWHELSQLYPDIFKEDISAADMPRELADIINRLRNSDTSELEFEYNLEFIAQDILYDVYDSYWNASTLYSVADQHERFIKSLKGKHNQRMQAVYQRQWQRRVAVQGQKGLSPRELLVNQAEGMAANSEEYGKLQEYRRKIQELNATEEKIERLDRELMRTSMKIAAERKNPYVDFRSREEGPLYNKSPRWIRPSEGDLFSKSFARIHTIHRIAQ